MDYESRQYLKALVETVMVLVNFHIAQPSEDRELARLSLLGLQRIQDALKRAVTGDSAKDAT